MPSWADAAESVPVCVGCQRESVTLASGRQRALCAQVTVFWWGISLAAAVCARIETASATDMSVLLAKHPILADLTRGQAERAKRELVDKREFACVTNARGEALAVSLLHSLHELQRRSAPDAAICGVPNGRSFSYRANVTPLALLLGLYCEARLDAVTSPRPYVHFVDFVNYDCAREFYFLILNTIHFDVATSFQAFPKRISNASYAKR